MAEATELDTLVLVGALSLDRTEKRNSETYWLEAMKAK
jgi:hypothetical protein